ncbi:FAD:protein FMN transferase [Nocardioides panacis]|uniref:FAD:protein FMN transferase n=1 Tax=Nocardioides panacis TaxID=2849501 RepID=A0A975T1R2_9ACTN|nr:FAD:protein FMN transferase [Nocardioides panacis]QWZ09273.1 FAD:protein FMN transferase [Nocardioides panacis]
MVSTGSTSRVVPRAGRLTGCAQTYRADWFVSRLDRGEVILADGPPEVAEVLALGELAEEQSGGADRAAAHLAALAGTDFCLSAGGDLVCRTLDPASDPWRIGIEDPHDPSRLVATVPVRTGAGATSGTAHRGEHLVDGRTGLPRRATAAYARGPDAARWLGTRAGRTGVVVWSDGSTALVG